MLEKMIEVEIIFWGTGNVAKKFVRQHELFMQAVKVIGFTDGDENKWNTFFTQYSVLQPDVLLRQRYDYILILSSYFEEIKKRLVEQYGVSLEKILSIDDAYQMYVRRIHGVENGRKFRPQTLFAESAFTESMHDRALSGANNMLSYLYIQDKYKKFIGRYRNNLKYDMTQYSVQTLKKNTPIWICWLQGREKAPDIVKCCINSIIKNVEGKVHIITYSNYEKYVKISKHILEKHRLGIIDKTHFSDIMRLALLCKYGGIWMDATIFMMDRGLPDYIYKAPMFMYKIGATLDQGYPDPRLFTNWFIKSEKENPILNIAYRLHEEWWKAEKETPYFLFHYIMRLVWSEYQSLSGDRTGFRLRIYGNNNCQALREILDEKYDEVLWSMIKEDQPLQKLTYKVDFRRGDSFYEYIRERYGTDTS